VPRQLDRYQVRKSRPIEFTVTRNKMEELKEKIIGLNRTGAVAQFFSRHASVIQSLPASICCSTIRLKIATERARRCPSALRPGVPANRRAAQERNGGPRFIGFRGVRWDAPQQAADRLNALGRLRSPLEEVTATPRAELPVRLSQPGS